MRWNLEREFKQVISSDLVEGSVDSISFEDLSAAYFQLSPVPRSWYAGESQKINEIGRRGDRRKTLEALGDYLDRNATGNLVIIDSLSDLAALGDEQMGWGEIALVVKGLRRAAR